MQLPAESYQPDIEQAFTVDFITRHKDQPFFFYYAMHLVHKPTVITPDSQKSAEAEAKARHNNNQAFYDDNIGYMDKQVGEIVALLEKLGLREKTLVLFSGDNGTAVGYGSSLNGRQINGSKGSMLEGGSRVPLIASLPGVVAAGKVSKDIVSFADLHPTFAEIGGAPLAQGKVDGISFAPQLLGQPGQPRQWAYVQLGPRWFVREQNWKMNQAGELFDMTDAPYVEKPVPATSQTPDAAAARMRLKAVLDSLKPGSGKVETNANGAPARRRNRNAKT
jgi:arylsulfatase A